MPKDAHIRLQNGQLTLSGERETEKQRSDDEAGLYQMERSFGSFMRAIPLPADAAADGITAESKDGVLTIRVPRTGAIPAPRKIGVQ